MGIKQMKVVSQPATADPATPFIENEATSVMSDRHAQNAAATQGETASRIFSRVMVAPLLFGSGEWKVACPHDTRPKRRAGPCEGGNGHRPGRANIVVARGSPAPAWPTRLNGRTGCPADDRSEPLTGPPKIRPRSSTPCLPRHLLSATRRCGVHRGGTRKRHSLSMH
jgi:hypothetical protein